MTAAATMTDDEFSQLTAEFPQSASTQAVRSLKYQQRRWRKQK